LVSRVLLFLKWQTESSSYWNGTSKIECTIQSK